MTGAARTLLTASLGLSLSLGLTPTHAPAAPEPKQLPGLVKILGREGYREEVLHKLAKPKLLYYDYEGFLAEGWAPEEITEENILNRLGYAKPLKGEAKSLYTGETAVFYSDYYGGEYIAYNYGSGRAASRGGIQLKGIGQTAMISRISKREYQHHASGKKGIKEGVFEVLRSHAAANEFPYGANRVLALFATGSKVLIDGIESERVVVARPEPLRPAHAIANDNFGRGRIKQEKDRAASVQRRLKAKLEGVSLRHMIFEMYERAARTAAFAYVNRYYHGAITASNLELNGQLVDFGLFLAVNGYERIGRSPEDFNGNGEGYKQALGEFLQALHKSGAVSTVDLPTLESMNQHFDYMLARASRTAFLVLTGLPLESLDAYAARESRLNVDLSKFATLLRAVAYSGNDEFQPVASDYFKATGHYDLQRILTKLASSLPMLLADIKTARLTTVFDILLRTEIPNWQERRNFVHGYLDLVIFAADWATENGVSLQNLAKAMAFAAEARNRPVPLLTFESLASGYWSQVGRRYQDLGDSTEMQRILAAAIAESRRYFHDSKPFTVVLAERALSMTTLEREVFYLKTGELRTEEIDLKKRGLTNARMKRDLIPRPSAPALGGPSAPVSAPALSLGTCRELFTSPSGSRSSR